MGFAGYVATPVYNKFFEWVGHAGVAQDVVAAFKAGDRKGTATAMSDEFVDDMAIIGSPEQCREKLAAFVEAGVTTPVLAPLASNGEQAAAMLEAFAPAKN
jgi:alkanesulfonate monooxygenase SsuD/methylene tetrahydromethanopterin reductase-like flavin-dependent oxidoreductase (luciferase family)